MKNRTLICFFALTLLFLGEEAFSQGWWNPAWQARREVTAYVLEERTPDGEVAWCRFYTMGMIKPDGSDVRVVDDYGHTSHFIWRDPSHILAWARHPSHRDAFYLYEDGARDVEGVGIGVITRNGHCTYLPDTDWILNDAYPDGERNQELYLYHVPTGAKHALGNFHSPTEYRGEWRCDLHPRFSPDGTKVCIDSPHTGEGRQLHLLDVSEIVST